MKTVSEVLDNPETIEALFQLTKRKYKAEIERADVSGEEFTEMMNRHMEGLHVADCLFCKIDSSALQFIANEMRGVH